MASAKNIILSIAIAIVFMLLGVYGVNLIYEEPQYQDFCKETPAKPFPVRGEPVQCQSNPSLQAREQQCYANGSVAINYEYDENGCAVNFECSSCNKDWEADQKKWQRTAFISAVVIGIIGIVLGAVLFSLESVGAGLMGGGAFLIFVFAVRVWHNLGDIVRFVILLFALAILIYLGYLINRKSMKRR